MKKYLSYLITLVVAFILYYMMLPPINLHSASFYFFIILVLIIFMFNYSLFSPRTNHQEIMELLFNKKRVRTINGPSDKVYKVCVEEFDIKPSVSFVLPSFVIEILTFSGDELFARLNLSPAFNCTIDEFCAMFCRDGSPFTNAYSAPNSGMLSFWIDSLTCGTCFITSSCPFLSKYLKRL